MPADAILMPEKTKPSGPEVAAPHPLPVQAEVASPPEPRAWDGDRVALLVWLGGIGLMAALVLLDTLWAFFRPL